MSRKFSEKNERVAETVSPGQYGSCKRLRIRGALLSPEGGQQISSRHFCAMRRHLSAESGASDEAWSSGGEVRRPGASFGRGKKPVELSSTDSRGRLSLHMNRGGAGLTCLSVRCLSSYLNFSASSSDKQAAVRFAGARLDGLVRRL